MPRQWEWGNQIKGGVIRQGFRELLLEQYQDELIAKKLKVAILRFDAPAYIPPFTLSQERELTQYRAAEDSTNVKIAAFRKLNVEVFDQNPLPQNMTRLEFESLINDLNADSSIRAIIVQYPVPAPLAGIASLIASEKDLDSLSTPPGFSVPATSEGIFRLVKPFADTADRSVDVQSEAIARLVEPFAGDGVVAVVGAKGFVGRGVTRLLQERGITYISIDRRDEGFQDATLLQVRNADIVVSATGEPGILDERHLTPYHRLVVDCGYVPLGSNTLGDVAESARVIPQNITPVPGGTGPVEMAILMERIVRKEIDPNLEPWRLQDYQNVNYYTRPELNQLQQQWAMEVYPIAKNLLVAMASQLQQITEGIAFLDGEKYKLIVNSNTETLAIESQTLRGEVARFTLKGDLQSAAGLTATDYNNWQATQRSLQTFQQRQQDQSQNQDR